MGNFDIDEIHEIRKEHSEKIKNMSFKQIQEEMNSSLESILKEYKSICEEKELKNLKIAKILSAH